MPKPLFRTYTTDLTDGELALFDVLFNSRASFGCLIHQGFVERFNHCSHGYDDDALRTALNSLCRRNLLLFDADLSAFAMTESGGELWSLERCPIWQRFASERYGQHLSGKESISIVATSGDTLDEILAVGRSTGMWQLDRARIRRTRLTNHELVPWRRFPVLHTAVAVSEPINADRFSDYIDVIDLERRRVWWRNVRELQKLLSTSAAKND